MADLRYSDRRRIGEQGSLGPVQADELSSELRHAVKSLVTEAATAPMVGAQFVRKLKASCAQHFGRPFADRASVTNYAAQQWISVEDFLDFVELVVEEAEKPWIFTVEGQPRTLQAYPDVQERISRIFVRHRFAYRIDCGQIHRIGSPALDSAITGPALLAVARPGWEEADRSFREALSHQRGGPAEYDDALTAATAALEAALKAAGLKGDRLGPLAKSLRGSSLIPPQLEGVPEALDVLLKRSSSVRDPFGDAHGKAPGADPVPPELVDLTIYWTGAFINFLAAAVD